MHKIGSKTNVESYSSLINGSDIAKDLHYCL